MNNGSGLTFTENDIKAARLLLASIGKATFALDVKGVMELGPALVWFSNLIPAMQANIFEVGATIEPEAKGKKK